MIPIGTKIAVVAETREQVNEAFMRLARVGHDSVTGYLLIGDCDGELTKVEQLPVETVKQRLSHETQFVDVRRAGEHNAGHAPGTVNIPLDKLAADIDKLDPAKPTYVICQGGYRSSLGTSILENAGFKEIYNVTGGTAAWMAAGLETEASATVCAVTGK